MGRGVDTRQTIVEQALRIASIDGLSGLSIGTLATELGLSKSGLFAHFRSKEKLQLDVLEEATQQFVQAVVVPALKKPRGEPRIREMVERWLRWSGNALPGGCVFIAAAAELDDKPGPVRDQLVESQGKWIQALARAAQIAVEEGHFKADLDVQQFTFELYSLMLGAHHFGRLLRDSHTKRRIRVAVEGLLDRARATPNKTSH